jgi:hypothetical protein
MKHGDLVYGVWPMVVGGWWLVVGSRWIFGRSRFVTWLTYAANDANQKAYSLATS